MRMGIQIEVIARETARLGAIVAARSSLQKHVWRARIILLTASAWALKRSWWRLANPRHA
jgi:hypothetical protein